MLRILNAGAAPTTGTLPGAAEPQVTFFAVLGDHFIYDANSMALAHVEPGLWRTLRDNASAGEEFGGIFWSRNKPQFHSYPPRTQALVLNVTHNCNLACRYCFVRNIDDYRRARLPEMTYETAIESIQHFFPRGNKVRIDVGFFGGEPFLRWNLMKRVVEWVENEAKQRGVERKFYVTTNATLVDEERAKWLALHEFSPTVSLDGNEVTHNAMRPSRNPKQNSWLMTMKGLEQLAAVGLGLRVTLRSTFTGEGVDLTERLRDLNTLVWRGMGGAVAVEPSSLSEASCIDASATKGLVFDPNNIRAQLGFQYEHAAEWYIEQINDGRRPHFHHFDIFIRRLLWCERNPSECGAGKGYICINPEGHVHACHRETRSRIGALPYGIDEELRTPWLDNRLYARTGCMACDLRYLCGGGCRLNSLAFGLPISQPVPDDCIFKRLWFESAAHIMAHIDSTKLQQLYPPKRGRKINVPARRPEHQRTTRRDSGVPDGDQHHDGGREGQHRQVVRQGG